MEFSGCVLFHPTRKELFRDGAGTKFFRDESEAVTYKALACYNPTLGRCIEGFEARPATCNVGVDAIEVIHAP